MNNDGNESIRTVMEAINPDTARSILSRNAGNRPLRSRTLVEKIARDIKSGRWQINGATIRISKDGRVLDGQHRLNAIVEAGVPVKTLVVYGLDDECFHTIDTNQATRTASDIFAIRGDANYTILAAALRLIYFWKETGDPYNTNPKTAPTPWQLENLLDENPSILESVGATAGRFNQVKNFLSKGTIAFCHYVFSVSDEPAAEEFFRRMASGVGLGVGSPVLLLRNRLIASKSGTERMSARYKTAITFKAFRLFRDGASITTLRVRENGPSAEKDIFQV